jgi:sec-independent protein translocase protein TatB
MLSIPHLIIIFVVALVVLGPERLPELARTIGKVMGEFRRATGDLRSTFEGHLRDLEREADQRKIGGSSRTAEAATGATASPAGETAASPPADAAAAPTWPESAAPPMTAAEGTVAAEAPRAGATAAEVVTPETNPEKTGGGGVGAA